MWKRMTDLRTVVSQDPARIAREARARLSNVADRGETRLWKIETRTLARVSEALRAAPPLPVVGRVADLAERAVDRRLDALNANPIADFDALNAKDAARAARDLRKRVALWTLRRYEVAHKNRKTVLDAVDETLARLGKLTIAEA